MAENKAMFTDGLAVLLNACGDGRYDGLKLEYFIEGNREYVRMSSGNGYSKSCSVNMDSLPAMMYDIGKMIMAEW